MLSKEALADIDRKMKVLDRKIKEQDRSLNIRLFNALVPNVKKNPFHTSLTQFSQAAQQHFEDPFNRPPETYIDPCDLECYREYQERLEEVEAENSRKKEEAKATYLECINEC